MNEFTKAPKFVDELYQGWQYRPGDSEKNETAERTKQTDRPDTRQARHSASRSGASQAAAASNGNRRADTVPASLQQAASKSDTSAASWRSVFQQLQFPSALVPAYDWRVRTAERIGNVARMETNQGTFALKRAEISSDRIGFIQDALAYAEKQGFGQLSPVVNTRKGTPYATVRGHTYYATHWIDGQTVDFANNRHVGKVAQALARFHERTRGFAPKAYQPQSQFGLRRLLKQRSNDLNTLIVEAQRRPLPGRFEQVLKGLAEPLLGDAENSVAELGEPACQAYLTDEERRPGLCHLDVIPSNFIIDTSGRVFLIDFDLMAFAPRALDLAHLMRRSLQMQSWNSETAYTCFLQYNAIRTMNAAEYQVVHALLTFPFRAWRLIHTRYRQFEEPEQVRWLETYQQQEEKRQAFLRAFEKQIIHK